MDKSPFLGAFQAETASFNRAVSTDTGDWVVKGFIDIAKNIYTISLDTKVISKIMELLLFPQLVTFARKHNLKMLMAEYQNSYPDITFVDGDGHRFALDIKTTYRIDDKKVNGMTLERLLAIFVKEIAPRT